MPTLHQITIYPIKSFDGVVLKKAQVLASGALANDRRYALVDPEGLPINGKRTANVHRIRANYDLEAETVWLRAGSDAKEASFSLTEERAELSAWFSESLGIACQIVENQSTGFPDDTGAPGPTLLSKATLQEVIRWFPGLTLDEARQRFRANLEIDEAEPFWEDRLIDPTEEGVRFSIGEVDWLGMKACQRCVVPARDSLDGKLTPGFQKKLAAERKRTLPTWGNPDCFDHFYRLAVNTRLAPGQSPGLLRRGDPVSLG